MRKPKRKKPAGGIQSASGKVYKRGTTGSKLVAQAQSLARRLPLTKQGALRVAARPPEPNYLRHVSEYLARQRRDLPLATAYPKEGLRRAIRDEAERKRLLAECERRKARREVLHASGHAGSKKRYPGRAKPGQRIDCNKFRR